MGKTTQRLPTYFLSHGGGPWPWLDGPVRDKYDQLEAHLAGLLDDLQQPPRAILVVTAHWETRDFMVSSGCQPGMIYDYGGFPEHTYHVTYQAPGEPELAAQARTLLQAGGFPCAADDARGFDHGTFSLMQIIRPQADIPVVQLSIRKDYDPVTHFAAGRSLAPLRDEGVLIIGSGLSYHNLRAFGAAGAQASAKFDQWLSTTLLNSPADEWRSLLSRWESAPAARACHPSEDHLVPLFVVAGASAGDSASRPYHEDRFFDGLSVSSFGFGVDA